MLNELSALDFDELCDTRGLNCPMPVLKSQKMLTQMEKGQKLCLLATDQMSAIDVPVMCNQQGWQLCHEQVGAELSIFVIKK